MKPNLTLAIPTGRIFKETVEILTRAGWEVSREDVDARRLHLSNGHRQSFILAKDRDVPTYVEHGIADAGIVGEDVLAEANSDVYQPLDLGIGRCRMVVARREDDAAGAYLDLPIVRVATKYPRVASEYFHGRGIPVKVIPLSGSVELAPVLGLADCIVDVVQTGKTLAANGLVEDEILFESSARLIANRAAFRLKRRRFAALVGALEEKVAR
jgi:ATP phosphoribosyltransferase